MNKPLDVRFSRIALKTITLHVAEAGPQTGPLLILLHGFPEFWFGWRNQIMALAEAGYHVVVPDQRGINLSDKPVSIAAYDLDRLAGDVIALADHYRRERIFLAGHDWGAIVAWWTAQEFPERIGRVAALSAGHPAVWSDAFRNDPRQRRKSTYVRLFQIPWLPERVMGFGGYKALTDAITDTARPGTVTADELRQYRQAWSQPRALTSALNWYRAVWRRTFAPPSHYRIKPPALMIWGTRDRYGEPALAENSVRLCDHGERVTMDATHWLLHDEKERVARLLIDFFGRD